ncbi:MAG: hypothetical protein KYX69_05425 [Sphingomonas sp.]|uniref:hypothetical protein n=1 Tax=Sphingomonas sp. TaxID=28214 RepID=UPI002619CE01|nr:hypothetical protein [Sphingomonas sp.]MDK2767142.1 hypothetical protein [Sphingomonas sp.]
MDKSNPASVGLCGDLDEIAAIDEIEAIFGVTLDYADAPSWQTAGDVFRSLLNVLPADVANASDTWDRFAAALTHETGVDPATITPNSPLLDEALPWRGLGNLSRMMAMLLIASAAILVLLVLVLR